MSALIRRLVFLFALALLAIAGTNGASAAGHTVSIVGTPQSSSFSPASLTIALNDTVTWMNESPTVHYVVFAGASPVAVQNNTPYTKTFTSPGTFSYYCSKHPSMTGTIIVLGPPPTPAPTAPPTPAPSIAPPAPTVAPPPTPAPTVAPPPPTPAPVIQTVASTSVPTFAPASPLASTAATDEEPTPEPVAVADVTPTSTPEPTLEPPLEPVAVAPVERAASVVPGDPAEPRLAAAADGGVSPLAWWSAFTAATASALGLLFWLFFFGPLRVRRYWFEFDVDTSAATSGLRARLAHGCGVTGRDADDCLELIKRNVLAGNELPEVRRVIRDVDLSTLEALVRRTMDGPRARGVWYPTSRA